MQPWFVWKNESSLDYGLWISELPSPTRAQERSESIDIPGRAGSLTFKEGENIHDSYTRDVKVMVRSDADFASILTWLSGDGQVIFSNEQDRVYQAVLTDEVKFDRVSNSLKQATIHFQVQPHKGQYPPEPSVVFDTDGTIYNPGTVASKPLVQITFTSTCTVSIGDIEMTFTAPVLLPPPEVTIYVDCEAQIITDEDGIWRGSSSGEFWQIPPGNCEIELTDAEISITPRWRWY